MTRTLITTAAVAALLLSGTAVAASAVAAEPTCGEAIAALASAREDATATQTKLNLELDAQKPLDAAEAAAQKAFDDNVDPTKVAELQAALNTAKATAAAGKVRVTVATTADKVADDKVVAAQEAVTKACRGQDGVDADDDDDVPQIPVRPREAPETGGGSAA